MNTWLAVIDCTLLKVLFNNLNKSILRMKSVNAANNVQTEVQSTKSPREFAAANPKITSLTSRVPSRQSKPTNLQQAKKIYRFNGNNANPYNNKADLPRINQKNITYATKSKQHIQINQIFGRQSPDIVEVQR